MPIKCLVSKYKKKNKDLKMTVCQKAIMLMQINLAKRRIYKRLLELNAKEQELTSIYY